MVGLIASTSALVAGRCHANAMTTRRIFTWSLVFSIAASAAFAQCPPPPKTATQQIIERIVDGDTVVLVGGDRVRVLGLNTFERKDPGQRGTYAQAASGYVTTHALGQLATLSPFPYRRDRHGRILAHVWVGGQHLAESVLKQGLGFAVAVPPLTEHAACLSAAEVEARRARRGLWKEALAPMPAASLTRGGFAVVEGTVTRVDQQTVWLGPQFAVTLPQDLLVEMGAQIEVRGWIRSPKSTDRPPIFRLPLGHPANLQRLSP